MKNNKEIIDELKKCGGVTKHLKNDEIQVYTKLTIN